MKDQKSKDEIIKNINEYINTHKDYTWFKAPTNIYEIEEITLLNIKNISNYSSLKDFTKLKSIHFGTTDCTMTIKDLAGLNEAKELESLSFSCKTKIKNNIEEISKLVNLKKLGLFNLKQSIPEELILSLKKLEFISLNKDNYTSIKSFPPLLDELSLSVSGIENLPKWKISYSLKNISCSDGKFENIDSLCCFPNLEKIKLYQCKSLVDIFYVKKLPNLERLEINFSKIKNLDGFKNHKSIEEINARGCDVINLDDLGIMNNMKKLYLEKSKLNTIKDIKSTFPNLELLWIWDTKVKDLAPIEGMTSLKELDLTLLKPKNWDFIKTLTGLKILDLFDTSFCEISLVMNLPKLKFIRLAKSKVDEKSKEYIELNKLLQTRGGEIFQNR